MGTVAQKLITFEEFLELPDPEFGRYEFDEGEVILVPPPKPLHLETIHRLSALLAARAPRKYRVFTEFAYQIRRERFIIADLGVTTEERWQATLASDEYFEGAPELVIEVLSPTNTAAEIAGKRTVSLTHGCREFWTVDPEQRAIEIFQEGRWRTYRSSDEIPIELFAGAVIPAGELFVPAVGASDIPGPVA
jgi:Uma2 family endonuclease